MTTEIDTCRNCARCEGTAKIACVICRGSKVYADKPCTFCNAQGERTCSSCTGEPVYYVPVIAWLVEGILAQRGPRKGRIARSRPALAKHNNRESARLYYVWRIARFHAGIDTTMPIGAETELGSDPFRRELDEVARLVAQRLTGYASVGASRWRQAMHGNEITGMQDIDMMLATGEAAE